MKFIHVFFLICLFLLCSCKNKTDVNQNPAADKEMSSILEGEKEIRKEESTRGENQGVTQELIQHEWLSGCLEIDSNFFTREVSFINEVFTEKTRYFAEDDCSGLPEKSYFNTGLYKLGEDVVTANGLIATTLRITYDSEEKTSNIIVIDQGKLYSDHAWGSNYSISDEKPNTINYSNPYISVDYNIPSDEKVTLCDTWL